VKENRGKVLKDITIEFKVRNGHDRVSERTVQRVLHTNTLYRLVVRKRTEEVNRKKHLALICL